MTCRTSWQGYIDNWFLPLPEFDIHAGSTALLVVDMQNFGGHPDYGMGPLLRERRPEVAEYFYGRMARTIIPNHIRLIDWFRAHGLRVIYVTAGAELLDMSDMPPGRLKKEAKLLPYRKSFPVGTIEHAIMAEVKPGTNELVLNKITAGAFASTGLDIALRNMRIETLVMTGIITNLCLETTARSAVERGYNVILVEDACAAHYACAHEATLATFGTMWGKVASTEQAIAVLEQSGSVPPASEGSGGNDDEPET